MITRISSIVLLLFLCLFLSACDDTVKPQAAKTLSPVKTKAKTIKTTPVETAEPEEDVYVYNPADSRDPLKVRLTSLSKFRLIMRSL